MYTLEDVPQIGQLGRILRTLGYQYQASIATPWGCPCCGSSMRAGGWHGPRFVAMLTPLEHAHASVSMAPVDNLPPFGNPAGWHCLSKYVWAGWHRLNLIVCHCSASSASVLLLRASDLGAGTAGIGH